MRASKMLTFPLLSSDIRDSQTTMTQNTHTSSDKRESAGTREQINDHTLKKKIQPFMVKHRLQGNGI